MRRERDAALGGLAGGKALVGLFEAVVDRFAHEMHERIGQPVDDRLVDFGAFAFRDEFDLLARFARKVVHQAAEAAEEARDRHHAQHHHRIAQFAGQTLDFLRNRAQAKIGSGAGKLGEARLGDDEFADPVHHLVKALGRDADILCGLVLLGIVDRLRGLALGEDGCQGCGGLDGSGRCGGDRALGCDLRDIKLHFVHDEDEDVFDLAARTLRLERHQPVEVDVARIEYIECRHLGGVGDDGAFAEVAHLVEQAERIGAVGHGIGRQAEADAPFAHAAGILAGARCHFGLLRRRSGHARTIDSAVQTVEQGCADGIMIAVRRFKQGAHMVLRGKNRRDQFVRCRDIALAHTVEGCLAMVREGGELVEAEHRA